MANQFKDLATESKKAGLALTKNWLSSSEKCCSRLTRTLDEIAYSASRIKPLTNDNLKTVNITQIIDELRQTEQEFGQISFNKDKNTVSVTTDNITLDDLYLGPFQIELQINKLSEIYRDSPYYCIALEPNSAATNEEVTHPHISSDKLCEGDGSAEDM